MGKKSLDQCRKHREFVSHAKSNGARVREGSNHTLVITKKGMCAIPRHDSKDIGIGLRRKIIKLFIKMGIACLIIAWFVILHFNNTLLQ